MYLPSHFEVTDTAQLHALMQAHPFATWVTSLDGALEVNHVPLHLDTTRGEHGSLIGHLARANPLWKAPPSPGVFVFQGPQSYVTPSWYPSKQEHGKVVPTWNYAVVHAHGTPRYIHDKAELHVLVSRLTNHHEAPRAKPWAVDDAPHDYTQAMLGAIVGVEIPIERLVGKFKLSQNRSDVDREGVRTGASADDEAARAMAQWMQR
jgi:transcriptional regulator